MFDQILQLVKDQLANHPAIGENISAEEADAMHHDIATKIHAGLPAEPLAEPVAEEAGGGILDQIKNSLGGGGALASALEGGLVGSLGSKFGLSPAITGAIAAALPGLIQKYTQKTADPLVAHVPAPANS